MAQPIVKLITDFGRSKPQIAGKRDETIMTLRTVRERIIQTLSYEAGGFLLAAPLYGLIVGHDASSSSLVVIAVALACMAWSPLHNTLFDLVDLRLTGRVASERPHSLRFVHALSHEITSIVVTTPIIMLMGGHSLVHALLVDIGLTLLYSCYAYFFHIAYDWLRPVAVVVAARPAERREPRIVATRTMPRSRSDDGHAPTGTPTFLAGLVVV